AQQVIKIVNEELTALMGGENARIEFPSKPPCIVLMCGLQGSGKTTHAAKLAKYFKAQGRRPLLIACDVYRPAAIEQLKIVGEKAGASVFEMGQGDPVKIAIEGVKHAKDHGNDLVIIDTAGRLHIDEKLMDELKNIESAVSPNEILLVVDSMTGQDAVNVADTFNNAIPITGVILTKLDSDTRGGAAISVLQVTGKPIKFSGIGEKIDDLEPFHPERMASRILGMGDVLTLIEKAQVAVDDKEAAQLAKKMKDNSFDMNDLLDQMMQIKKMGSLKQIISMLPGVGNKIDDMDLDDNQLVRIEAMITSMTKSERVKPSIINPNRKRRIAAGSGTRVEDVNRLLKQFEQMKQMMKKFGGKKGKRKTRFPSMI
ncbi:MAG: signal recognition particle protein, partial [Oscillospiraceae bacterium]